MARTAMKTVPSVEKKPAAKGFLRLKGKFVKTSNLKQNQKAALLSNVPSGRLGQGSEIAAAVVYLASQEAGYVTGSTLHVNGGMAML